MRFAAPEFLWALALLPPIALAAWGSLELRRSALRRFAGGDAFLGRFTVEVSVHRRAAKLLLLFLGFASIIVALARPQWGTRLEPITREGSDLVIVLDTSLSMATEDLAPNRISQAKHAIAALIDLTEGDRVALVTFAGMADLACPLTLDRAAVRLFLDSLDVDSVPVPGTGLAEALGLAMRTLRVDQPLADERGRAIVLFTDGEDHEGGVDEIVPSLARQGIPVYSVGCGTTRGGPIPIQGETGIASGYKKDAEGRVVTSHIDEALLENLALDTGGRYYRGTAGENEIREIAEHVGGMQGGELGSQLRTRYEERFQIPLAVGLLALLAETLIGDRRRVRNDTAAAADAGAA
jgi:Ca-activated chloride channel family protein